jgi:hypothetical protein
MNERGPARLLFYLLPGLVCGVLVLVWGARYVAPPLYEVPQWIGRWHEPKQPSGKFKSFRREGSTVVGETETWPHLHRRANAYLLSDAEYEGDIAVSLRLKFLRGRYLGCYLCYDPDSDTGYWLATGHAVGENPNEAYIKIVRNGKWEVVASSPLAIEADVEYRLCFQRTGAELAILVNGKSIVSSHAPEFPSGHVQLRLHNTKIELFEVAVGQSPVPSTVEE